MCKKVFLLGTGRCGTVTLFDILSTVPGVVCTHEGRVFSKNGVHIGDLGKMFDITRYIYYDDLRSSNVKYKNSKKFSKKHKRLRVHKLMDIEFFNRDIFMKTLGDDVVYCDINPYGFNHISYIYNKYPDAKFIHVIRNGPDVVRSYFLRKSTYPESKREHEYSLYESGKPRPTSDDPYFSEWTSMSKLKKTSWFWQYVNNDIQDRLSVVPEENKMLFKIEDLSNESVVNILNFIGASGSASHWSEILDCSIRSNVTPSRSKRAFNWNPRKYKIFRDICGDTMKRLGYE